jgi:group I intron endonuclease
MSKKDNYYVYIHVNKSNSKRYVGITCQQPNNRWKNGNGYKSSPHFYNSILKYGWDNFDHLIIAEQLSEEEAKTMEKQLIKQFNTLDKNYGYNQTEGGEGSSGFKHTLKTRKKMSEIAKNKTVSEETKEKMSKSMTGRKITWSDKISKSHIGDKNPSARPVVQLNSNYELINEFSCERYAEQELGINVVNISQVCLGKANSAGGYIFMFKEEYEEEKDNLIGKHIDIQPYKKKVIQLSLDGKYINTFDSISDASNDLGIDSSSISNVCKGKRQKTAGGFKWEYAS